MFSKIFAFCAVMAVCHAGFLGHSSHQGSQGHGVSSQSFELDTSIKSHNFDQDEHSYDHSDEHSYGHSNEHAYPRYNFKYSVSDDHTDDKKSHSESRDGDQVQGEYSLVQPDGKTRTVTYTADKHNGFKAEVSLTGGNQYGHQQFDDLQYHNYHH